MEIAKGSLESGPRAERSGVTDDWEHICNEIIKSDTMGTEGGAVESEMSVLKGLPGKRSQQRLF